MTANISRRVSYILPSPSHPPPLLDLPALGDRRRGVTSPYLVHKPSNGEANGNGTNGRSSRSDNPFDDDSSSTQADEPNHPRHCLGITTLALDTSTVLSDASAPGGILYSGGRDGLVASWELGVSHKRRRGGKYETIPGKGGRVRWERVGDGAELWDEDEDEEDEFGVGSATGGAYEEEDEWSSDEEEVPVDGYHGVDPDRVAEGLRRRRAARGEVPYEDRWEVDRETISQHPPPATAFRQSVQTHTDWVNAMILCNLNQTVITASADRTIHAWSPHSTTSSAPVLIGRHRDYVKSLAWAKYPSLLFSGALDRQIAIWDVGAPNHDVPLLSIDLNKADDWGGVGLEGERGSVYALGVDPAGRVLAAGTPERVIRMWDPRVGDKTIGKFIGHTDCVRSVLMSDDGKHMLTGSSDSTIKLWSVTAHRCLHTFNHHTSSIWALHSNHPNLERFYSGSRDGILAAVDVEGVTDVSDGECVVLSREGWVPGKKGDYETKSGDEGVRNIVAMDDEYVWTATGSAEIKRWRDVGRRVTRLTQDDDGVSYNQTTNGDIQVPVPTTLGLDQPFVPTPPQDGGIRDKRLSIDESSPMARTSSKDARVAFAAQPSPRENSSPVNGAPRRTTGSGANIAGSVISDMSGIEDGQQAAPSGANGIPFDSLVSLGMADSPYSMGFGHGAARSGDVSTSSMHRGTNNLLKPEGDVVPPLERARDDYEEREVASEAIPLRQEPDHVIAGRPGLVRSIILNDRQHVLTVDTEGEVAAWNIVKGVCVGRFSSADVAAALHLERGVTPQNAVRKHSVEVLEMVRDRVEGETMVITWCAVDTKIGSLVVHLEEGRVFDAEVYADESGVPSLEGAREDMRLNLGKWALANLFKGLIVAEEREVVASSPATTNSSLPSVPRSPEMRSVPIERGQSAHPHRQRAMTGSFSSQGPPTLNIPGLAVPAARAAIVPDEETLSKSAPASSPAAWQSFQALRKNSGGGNGTLSTIAQSPGLGPNSPSDYMGRSDYFSGPRRKDSSPSREPPTPGSAISQATPPGLMTPAAPPTPGGSKLGKLKFGKKKKADNAPMSPVVEKKEIIPEVDEGPKMPDREAEQLKILDTVRSNPFHPPSLNDAPPLNLPADTAVLISEESKDAGAWVVTYRSRVSSTEEDMVPLEMNSPLWLLDYLFTGRTKVKDPVKLTFILEPEPGCGLREMPEGTTRLSASRILRARKILAFIFDKLELGQARARAGSLASAGSRFTALAKKQLAGSPPPSNTPQQSVITEHTPAQSSANAPTEGSPEDTIELVCGNHIVDPKMTLATLKQYYGSGGDMLLFYRPRKGVALA